MTSRISDRQASDRQARFQRRVEATQAQDSQARIAELEEELERLRNFMDEITVMAKDPRYSHDLLGIVVRSRLECPL